MLVPLRYIYFLGSLISFIIWLIIFFLKPDLRKSMLKVSVFLGLYALFFEYFWWTRDWWHPETITYTRVGVEDFLTALGAGGIIMAIYPLLYPKKHLKPISKKTNTLKGILLIWLQIFIMILFVQIFRFTSFYATVIMYAVSTLILWYLRPDLIKMSLITAVIIVIGAIPLYDLLFYLTPEFVKQTWVLNNLSHIFLLGIPIEDLIFFFLLATFAAPFYWYINNEEFVNSLKSKK